jgi:hypothetical protein
MFVVPFCKDGKMYLHISQVCGDGTRVVEEAAEYSSIGINKIRELSSDPRCNFVIYIGKKRLIKRKEFEKFIADNVEL